jgi:hypothetical protein
VILPTKGVSPERALLTVAFSAAEFLSDRESATVSETWRHISRAYGRTPERLTFDWFVLALDLLHALGIAELNADGFLVVVHSGAQ